jgi:hypothetical protein
MRTGIDDETRAVERLIAQIDALDRWRDRTGRRVIWLFAVVFLAALALLGRVAFFDGPPPQVPPPPGPRVPAVLRNFNPR